ncbi:MAG: hypothetical protein U5O15_05605 [Candidatus Krumholzibacteriota bacterium]|nr:hypothetical protein [Candidatus Krumholzibacteriota bacterium]
MFSKAGPRLYKTSDNYFYRIILFILFILAISFFNGEAGAQAWSFGKNKVQYDQFEWQILKTPHFDIHFSKGYRNLAARTGAMLEDGYRDLSGSFEHDIKSRIPVIVYGSHSAFQQTNTTWSLIPEGVQAFAEPNRGRIVLHFSGSNEDYRNTAVHELIHIFEFDIIYGNLLRSVFSRSMLFRIPLWFAEGCSEYYSKGYDDEGEMFMRDAAIFDYLPRNLEFTGGYMAYKAGQSVIDYIVRTYGKRKIIDIMNRLGSTRSIERALNETIGISTEDLTHEWAKSIRRKYWPLYADKMEPEEYGRRVTDHKKNHHYRNIKPAISPGGEHIIYYSDREGLDGIFLMNAVTGEIEETLLKGQLSEEFESLRIIRSNLTINPEGNKIAFVAKSDGLDKLFIMSIPGGKVTHKIEIPLDFFYSPAWSPRGDEIAVVGVTLGQTDLYLYKISEDCLVRLTSDVGDEKDPSWFPDGKRLVYCKSERVVPNPQFSKSGKDKEKVSFDYFNTKVKKDVHRSDIWSVDIATGNKERIIKTKGDDSSPVIIDEGKQVVFSSNESGIWNLYRGSVQLGKYYRFTDVLGGIDSPTYSAESDRLAFTAFNSAGYDIFVIDSFGEKSKKSYSTGGVDVFQSGGSGYTRPEGDSTRVSVEDRINEVFPDVGDGDVAGEINVIDAEKNEDVFEPFRSESDSLKGGKKADHNGMEISSSDSAEKFPEVAIDEDVGKNADPDTLKVLRERMKKKVGTTQPYETKFSADYIGNGMGLLYSTGFGFGLMNQVAFSDLLGNHHLYLSFNIHRSIEDSDIMLSYYYLRKRLDYAFGIFQFKSYLNSRTTSLGEAFLDYRMFSERNYGLFGMVSYPFSTFTRLDLEMQAYVSQREFFDNYGSYYYPTGKKNSRRLFQPAISLVHDTAYYGSFGPVIGSRWMLSLSRSLSFLSDDLVRSTAFYDYRKYIPLFYRNYLAFRAVGSTSLGRDARYFFLGGPVTMRGYDYLQFQGSRMMLFNLEYRYPLVDAIIFGWPGRWALTNIGGTLFFDSGSVWGENRYVEKLPPGIEAIEINDLKFYSDFGAGLYMRVGMLILNFQLGWPTDFSSTGSPSFHFYIGPQF